MNSAVGSNSRNQTLARGNSGPDHSKWSANRGDGGTYRTLRTASLRGFRQLSAFSSCLFVKYQPNLRRDRSITRRFLQLYRRLIICLQLALCHADTVISRICILADLLSCDVWWWLLVNDEGRDLAQRFNSFLLDSAEEVIASWNVVDQTNDLACCPDLTESLARL